MNIINMTDHLSPEEVLLRAKRFISCAVDYSQPRDVLSVYQRQRRAYCALAYKQASA